MFARNYFPNFCSGKENEQPFLNQFLHTSDIYTGLQLVFF